MVAIEVIKYILLGFFVKIVTGLDDTITRIPLLASVTRSRLGKFAFSIGTLLAVTSAIIFALFFSSLVTKIPNYRYIIAGLIFALAIIIYFELFTGKKRREKEKKLQKMTSKKFFRLIGIGFVASFITVLDDAIAYIPVLTAPGYLKIMGLVGIYLALFLQITLIIYFARKISKFKYNRLLAVTGLIIIGILVLFGVI